MSMDTQLVSGIVKNHLTSRIGSDIITIIHIANRYMFSNER